jgi:16S rRNA (guanine966-N2)-methyltransferase
MGSGEVAVLLERLSTTGRLADDALVVVERSRRGEAWEWPPGLEGVRDKRYGETMLFYGRVRDATASPEQTDPITSR